MKTENIIDIYFRRLSDYISKQCENQLQSILSLNLVLVFTLFTIVNLEAQIKIHVKNPNQQFYYLQQIKGDRIITLDSLQVDINHLDFSWETNYQQGQYRVVNGENKVVFWANEQEIQLQINDPFEQKSLVVINSIENQIWLEYIEFKNINYQNLDLLNPIINWYDKDSEFYQIAYQEFNKQQGLLPAFVRQKGNKYQNNFILPFIQADLKPTLPMGLTFNEQKAYLQQHWFDGVDWLENSLINSDILTTKITEYLGLYADKNQSKGMLELAFKYAVDQIIPKTQDNPEMYAFVIDYLVRGFERYQLEEVIIHIAKNYPTPEQQCENEERKSEALARLEKYESMQIGQTAPNIELSNVNGENVNVSETAKENILIVFWASWCPHCKTLIPKIQDWYTTEKQETWQVYTISIDTEKKELESFLNLKNIHLETLCNYKGWDTQAAIDYNIYATPTMIVLDRNLNIVSKPTNMMDL